MKLNPTDFESKATRILKSLKVLFHSQIVIGTYIVDFVGVDRNFILEIDGKIHEYQRDYDIKRDSYFRDIGFNVFRIKNESVSESSLKFLLDLPRSDTNYIRSLIMLGSRHDYSQHIENKKKTYLTPEEDWQELKAMYS